MPKKTCKEKSKRKSLELFCRKLFKKEKKKKRKD